MERFGSRLRAAKTSRRAVTCSACLWEHVTSWGNAASSPGASQQSWCPPSLDVPSGNTLGSITHEATSARRRQIPRQPDSWLVSTRITKSSTPRLRHRAPSASNSFFFSRQSIAPHHHRRASHHASVPPRSRLDALGMRFVESGDVVGVFPSRCRLRALWRQALSSSFPALPHS